jgi:magnesium chelatase family protein
LLDRIDIHIDVSRVDYEKLSNDRVGKPSASIRQRVQAARETTKAILEEWCAGALRQNLRFRQR